MGLKNEDIFINQLIKETYESLPAKDSSQSSYDLYAYFTKQNSSFSNESSISKINEVLSSVNTEAVPVFINNETQCFTFEIDKLRFDMPMNMATFDELHEDNEDGVIFISEENDIDLINSAFSIVKQVEVESLLIRLNKEYFLVLLSKNQMSVLDKIEKLFGIEKLAA